MNSQTDTDPFERAVRRESMLRRRAAAMTPQAMMRMVAIWFATLGGVWLVILAGHWLIFPEPRWLAVLHTVVFALGVTFSTVAFFAQRHLARLTPGIGPTRDE